MRLTDFVQITEMSQAEQTATSVSLIKIFNQAELDVMPIFTQHFRERLWGREAKVNTAELLTAFSKAIRKHGPAIKEQVESTGKFSGTIKDYSSNLNVVFTVEKPVNPRDGDKYRLYGITLMRKSPQQFIVRGGDTLVVEAEVDDIVKNQTKYVRLPKPGKKRNKKDFPVTTKAQNSLIQTLWAYQGADAV